MHDRAGGAGAQPSPHRSGKGHTPDRIFGFMWSHLLALAFTLLLPAQALAGAKEKLSALAPSGLVLVMDERGNELVVQNADKPFVPASVAKIVTAWLAMEVLGADYRFETRFYLNGNRVLYIRGGGDPFLISEKLAQLASALVAAIGKQPLTGIVLDASYYPSDIRIPGIEDTEEAYDARNSALAVNFNTIHAVRKGNREADPDYAARYHSVPGAGFPGSRSHQPDAGPNGRAAIRRRADCRTHRARRRQPQGQDLDRTRAGGAGAGLRSPPVTHPFEDPRRFQDCTRPTRQTLTNPLQRGSHPHRTFVQEAGSGCLGGRGRSEPRLKLWRPPRHRPFPLSSSIG